MKFTVTIVALALLLTACRSNNREIRRELVGTWTLESSVSPMAKRSSWIDPVTFKYTFSSDGNFSEILGHRSEPVTYQGTWRIEDRELMLTCTNAQGTGRHQAARSEIGKVTHWKIVSLDDHQFMYTCNGRTNLITR